MVRTRGALVLALGLCTCGLASCDDGDFGLPRVEVAHTLQRLFAIPTTAYTNAYGEAGADMRPAMPTFTFGPEDGGIMKLAMPSFSLEQTGNAGSVARDHAAATTSLAERASNSGTSDSVMGALLGTGRRSAADSAIGLENPGSGLQEISESDKWTMGSQWLSLAQKSVSTAPVRAHAVQRAHSLVAKAAVSVQKATAGEHVSSAATAHKAAKGAPSTAAKQKKIQTASAQSSLQVHAKTMELSRNGAALSASALASVDGERVKALAQARLMKKSLASMKHEHTDATDTGPSMHGRAKSSGLDSQISGSGKWLAKAVMILATVAGTCICVGICAVIYCYRNRHQGDTDSTKIPTKEQQLNGKSFGRATPQYGSYGAKRR